MDDYEKFASLPFPLRNSGEITLIEPTKLQAPDIFGSGLIKDKKLVEHPSAEFTAQKIGDVKLLCLRCTPCIITEETHGLSTLALPFWGDQYVFKDGKSIRKIKPGDIHLNPRNGGIVEIGYFSGAVMELEQKRIARTIRSIGETNFHWDPLRSFIGEDRRHNASQGNQGRFNAFFYFVDALLSESTYLPASLGLDDTIYRLLSLAILETNNDLETIQQRWRVSTSNWTNRLDDLVDYIRQNAHLHLTLTDLEEQSHYSGRHLQNLFKERFDCTPMQFVRRQRLSAAMEKLQTADLDDTVTTIARDMGYLYTSNFTNDFQRAFGVKPSVVLRSSRGGGQIACDGWGIVTAI